MIKRDENKLRTSLKSGLLKLDVRKHFLGEDYSSCKDQQLFPVPGLCLPCSTFSGQDLLIVQNPTQMLLLSWSLSDCSPGLLLCCFCTLPVLLKEVAPPTVFINSSVSLLYWIMSLSRPGSESISFSWSNPSRFAWKVTDIQRFCWTLNKVTSNDRYQVGMFWVGRNEFILDFLMFLFMIAKSNPLDGGKNNNQCWQWCGKRHLVIRV